MDIKAKVIEDSIVSSWHTPSFRLVTMEVRMPRCILAELNTHRVFSRNSASSRAIPLPRFRQAIVDSPYYPDAWLAAQKGMTGGDELSQQSTAQVKQSLQDLFVHSQRAHVDLQNLGVCKQQANRFLEPWMYTTVLVSSSLWANFFTLRCNPAADPAMQATADAMLKAFCESVPKPLKFGEWHLPYYTSDLFALSPENQRMVCAMRCARVSYTSSIVTGTDPMTDLARAHDLAQAGHWSPFEHVATPLADLAEQEGNFIGWRQFRHVLEEGSPPAEFNAKKLWAERMKVSAYAQ